MIGKFIAKNTFIDEDVFTYITKRKSKGVELTYTEVDAIIKSVFPDSYCMRVLDNTCTTINRQEILELVADTKVKYEWYVNNDHDCDDYAFALNGFFCQKGLSSTCLGVMLSATHAYNFFIDDGKELWLYEPQRGSAFKYDGSDESYKTVQYIV